jgi:hypothetical protein
MDSILQAQFERVETALTSLVDSIASYNPSTQAAQDLVAADDELSVGLDERMLCQHREPDSGLTRHSLTTSGQSCTHTCFALGSRSSRNAASFVHRHTRCLTP